MGSLGYGQSDMKGYILTEPALVDNRHIAFVFFDEEARREIPCQTAGHPDAPSRLQKMKGLKQVLIEGGWETDDRGRPGVFRVDQIFPKEDGTSVKNKA